MKVRKSELVFLAIYIGCFFYAYFLLLPGQFGPYIIDDTLHFPRLLGGVSNFDDVIKWVFSGGEHGSGRFISYLSFLIDDNAWPNAPQDFKNTNILIHLLVGVLVFTFCRQILQIYLTNYSETSINYYALILAVFWLVAPMHQSAIYMAIQRMVQLMVLFVLCGLITYISGRKLIARQPKKGYLLITAASCVFLPLAVFSKEPGILMCMYILLLEVTILRNIKWQDPLKIYWKCFFIYLPLILVVVYYILMLGRLEEFYVKREFTLVQRLITEPKVILSYFGAFVMPLGSMVGPYQDDFAHSVSIFEPISTIFYILITFVALALGFRVRKNNPLIAFGLLVFFASHVMEGTILPLELYFEHRNYFGSIGILILCIGLWLDLKDRLRSEVQNIIAFSVVLIFAVHVFLSHLNVKTWSDRVEQALVWGHYHPNSKRAHLDMTRVWLDVGREDKALDIATEALEMAPNQTGFIFYTYLLDYCLPEYQNRYYREGTLMPVLRNGKFDHAVLAALVFAREGLQSGRCAEISDSDRQIFIEALLGNENFKKVNTVMAVLYQELSTIRMNNGDLEGTLDALSKAYHFNPSYHIALNQAYLSLSSGAYGYTQDYIDIAKNAPFVNKYEFLWRNKEIQFWEDQLELYKAELREDDKLQ